MKNPKTKAILEQVRILAQTYPDFVYRKVGCEYNYGGDPKYPDLCGCIIGQAARKAGFNTSDWDEKLKSSNFTGALVVDRIIKHKLEEDNLSKEALILSDVQYNQDIGFCWITSYVKAMEMNS